MRPRLQRSGIPSSSRRTQCCATELARFAPATWYASCLASVLSARHCVQPNSGVHPDSIEFSNWVLDLSCRVPISKTHSICLPSPHTVQITRRRTGGPVHLSWYASLPGPESRVHAEAGETLQRRVPSCHASAVCRGERPHGGEPPSRLPAEAGTQTKRVCTPRPVPGHLSSLHTAPVTGGGHAVLCTGWFARRAVGTSHNSPGRSLRSPGLKTPPILCAVGAPHSGDIRNRSLS